MWHVLLVRGMPKAKNYTGFTSGKLKIKEYVGSRIVAGKKRRIYEVECECGNIIHSMPCVIVDGRKKSCGCEWHKTGNLSPRWGGHGEISGNYWDKLRRGAKSRNYEFNITIEYAWEIFLKQNKKCKLSGIELSFGGTNGVGKTASLDRINNGIGYLMGNCQWLHKDVNRMKQTFSENVFLSYCQQITKFTERVK